MWNNLIYNFCQKKKKNSQINLEELDVLLRLTKQNEDYETSSVCRPQSVEETFSYVVCFFPTVMNYTSQKKKWVFWFVFLVYGECLT